MREYTRTMAYLDSLVIYFLAMLFSLLGVIIADGAKAAIIFAVIAVITIIAYFVYFYTKGTKKIDCYVGTDPNKIYEDTRFVMCSRAISAVFLLAELFLIPMFGDRAIGSAVFLAAGVILATATFLMIRKKVALVMGSSES